MPLWTPEKRTQFKTKRTMNKLPILPIPSHEKRTTSDEHRATSHESRAANKKMQNEPNFKNTQINLRPVKTRNYGNFHPHGRPKNEPNSNPIYGKLPQFAVFKQFPLIYEIFILIFTNFYTNSPPIYELSTLHSDENGNFHPLDQRKFMPKLAPKVEPVTN